VAPSSSVCSLSTIPSGLRRETTEGNEKSNVCVAVAVEMMFSKNCATPSSRMRQWRQRRSAGGRRGPVPARESKMSTFGYYPGPIDYWMLITDWRNGSIAILLAMGAFLFVYALTRRSPALVEPADALPAHLSPAIGGDNVIDEVSAVASRQRIET
jgi:hypothetical protein